MALQDGRFANEPDARLIKETLGRLLGAKFGVDVKLIESTPVKKAGETAEAEPESDALTNALTVTGAVAWAWVLM